MAVVPDKRVNYLKKLRILKTNRHIVLEALQQLTRPTRLPTPLDYHNYSKYPHVSVTPQNEFMQIHDDYKKDQMEDANSSTQKPLTISIDETSVRDLLTPLTIQTSISPTPSSSSSTDTSSEIGSAFNSPNTTHSDVDERINQIIVCKMIPKKNCDNLDKSETCNSLNTTSITLTTTSNTNLPNTNPSSNTNINTTSNTNVTSNINTTSNTNSSSSTTISSNAITSNSNINTCLSIITSSNASLITNANSFTSISSSNSESSCLTSNRSIPSPAFTAKDLVSLLKRLEVDINQCESNLSDELEKRKKYRIDDSRRTHNYDQFITTFLAMLAEQKKLADLVERDLGLLNSIPSPSPCDSPPSSPNIILSSLLSPSSDINFGRKKKKKLKKQVKFKDCKKIAK